MPKVTIVNPDETQVVLDIDVGNSVMRAATGAAIDGIVGDCGGGLTCATCHVRVDEAFLPFMPEMTPNEDQMLDFTAMEREANSRLSCQIVITDDMDGMTVIVADPQL